MSLPDDHPWNPAESPYVLEEFPAAFLGSIEDCIAEDELGTIEAYFRDAWPREIFPGARIALPHAGAEIPSHIRSSSSGEIQRKLRTPTPTEQTDAVYLKVVEAMESQVTLGSRGTGGALYRERGEVVCTISCYRRLDSTRAPRERGSRYVGTVKNIFHQITLPTSREIERALRKRHCHVFATLLPDNCRIRFDREFNLSQNVASHGL